MRRFMKWLSLMSIYSIAFLMVPLVFAEDLTTLVNNQLSGLVEIYKDLHAHPELSHQESRTSALLATELRKAGYTVTEHIGKYSDGTNAYGVVAVLENGPGPWLLIRGDMDALPMVEETGLSYSSHLRAKNSVGQDVGVMHACGHDIHVTALIGTARALAALKSQWHGTAMFIGQPSEETFDGAKAMLNDHIYERFGTPNLAFGDWDDFHPRWSPDGEWIAYISNEGGLPQLCLLETYGGEKKKIRITARHWKGRMSPLLVRVVDKSGRLTPARIYLTAADKKFYAPPDTYA